MKNITHLQSLDDAMKRWQANGRCVLCGLQGYFSESSMGRCGAACPCCGHRHFLDWGESNRYRMLYDTTDSTDMRNRFLYCKDCGILFELGCVHYGSDMVTADDTVYNAHVIKKWKHRQTGEVFDGMPCFSTAEDWFTNVCLVQVLEIECPSDGGTCCRNRCSSVEPCPLRGKAGRGRSL